MATTSSSSPPPPPPPPRPTAPLQPSSSSRRLPPPCWTNEETTALIDAYRLKWYSLNRGNLKASHWQEVADSVIRECPHVSPPKTSLQCRHKVEKLRKRYRNEKQRYASSSSAKPPSWPFYRKMESMENGAPSPNSDTTDEDDDDDDAGVRISHTPTVQGLRISNSSAGSHRGGGRSGPAGPRIRIVKREMEEEEEEDGGGGFGTGKRRRTMTRIGDSSSASAAEELVSAIRTLGEGFVRMERVKLDMAREAERMRMDMEMKRTEMILESQQRIVEAFLQGFGENRNDRSDKKKAAASPQELEQ